MADLESGPCCRGRESGDIRQMCVRCLNDKAERLETLHLPHAVMQDEMLKIADAFYAMEGERMAAELGSRNVKTMIIDRAHGKGYERVLHG